VLDTLKDKVVLITGASRGIGRAIALLAAENGARVIVNYNRSEAEAAGLVVDINGRGQSAMAIKADVSKEDDVRAMFNIIKEKYGRLDILVNNAGIMKNNLLIMTRPQEFDEIFNINCRGTFLCMQYAAKMMIRQKSGKIINLSSIVGVHGSKGQTAYSASKSMVIGLTKAAAKELGYYGITVNALAPGFIETDLTKDVKDSVRQELIKNTALGRAGNPGDIAKAALFLCSDMGNYVNGQIIGVDGGEIM
jgi:3-oxoacyl-[acyl-carrier protein] reductase